MPFREIALAVGKKAIAVLGPVALAEAGKQFKKYTSVDHGSKVKTGQFAGASIKLSGDMAYIKLNEDSSRILPLTPENIESCRYMTKKKRQVGLESHTYYYYEITFKDGSKCTARMRKKYREAMIKHGIDVVI